MSFMYLSFSDGWLLDIAKLTLGENIGEGEFGGEFRKYQKEQFCCLSPLRI